MTRIGALIALHTVNATKEDRTMAEKILVPLKKDDRPEEFIPYIQKVTQPGASVVFLVHHPVNSLKWLQAYCGVMECGLETTMAMRRMFESYSMNTRKQLAQQKVFYTCEALHRLGVKVGVEIYTGSMRKALSNSVFGKDVDLIVMRPGVGRRIMNFLQGMASIRDLIRRTAFSPVLVLNTKGQI
jgi:hypothetical protein